MSQLTILSFGGGQDSTALLYLYHYDAEFRAKYAPNDFMVVMSNTGDEHPRTYEHLTRIVRWCFEQRIEFHFLQKQDGYHYDKWPSLREFYRRTNTVGSKAFPKTCTDKLKIQPIYKFVEEWVHKKYNMAEDDIKVGYKRAVKHFAEKHGKIRMMIGIAKGEEERMADRSTDPCSWRRKSVEYSYPLIELGMDRKACQVYIDRMGHKVPPPSNCMLCPFMSEIELVWLLRHYPNDLYEWIDIEAKKIEANKHLGDKNLGVWGKKLLPQVLAEALDKFGHMTVEQLDEYKMSHGHCVMSKY